jgi:hypothetical protein
VTKTSPPLVAAALAAIALTGCYDVTFPINQSFVVDVPTFDLEQLSESPDGWVFEESGPIQDTDELMSQLPDSVQSVAYLELLEVTITSPVQGNLGEYLTDIALYVSTDDVLSDDDDRIVFLPELPPEQVQYVVPFPAGTTLQKYVDAGTLAIIITGTLVGLPGEDVAITLDVSAQAVAAAF